MCHQTGRMALHQANHLYCQFTVPMLVHHLDTQNSMDRNRVLEQKSEDQANGFKRKQTCHSPYSAKLNIL